jgi:hypothetical protein
VRDWLGHSNIEPTSTYLANTLRTQHDAMSAYVERRPYEGRLQEFANQAGNKGSQRPHPASDSHEMFNETRSGTMRLGMN